MGKITSIEQESKIELNTEKGQTEFKTDIMNGTLNSIIIDSSDEVEIIIESSLGYLILKRKVLGIEYIAPRVRVVPSDDDMRDILTFDKFKLNEGLSITIIGLPNTDVSLIFRLD